MDETTLHGVDLEQIQEDVKEKGQELIGRATEFARQQPHLAVAAAFGIGWILGNGLSPRIVTAGARLGMKTLLGGALAGTGLAGILGGESGGLSALLGGLGERGGEEDESSVGSRQRAPRSTQRGEASRSEPTRRNGNTD